MEPINVDFTGKGSSGKGKGKSAYLVPKKSGLKTIIAIIGTIIGGVIAYYFMLPPLNFKSTETYIFFGLIAAIYIGLTYVLSNAQLHPEYMSYVKKQAIVPGIIIAILVVIVGVGTVISSVVLRAKSYSEIIAVDESKEFSEEIEEADFSSVPVLDNAAASVLANRTLGDLAKINKESQFEVAQALTQINYKGSPVKLLTLTYGDIFKWLKNTGEGLPGYIIVDMVTQKAELKMLPEGEYIRYTPYEHFGKYLMRHVRFSYPTYIFDTPRFEIDDSGKPFWIVPVLDRTIGLFGGTDVKGIVMVDAITGDMVEYTAKEVAESKELQWLDGIYSADLLVEQFNYYGQYKKGFINSILGQDGVRLTTEGSNFLARNDDVYLYTGVTSVSNDQAIIGFILINMRTKQASYYAVSGAKETSAQASAQGEVQDYNYRAAFPILLNINGQPTYFMSLKDSSDIVKRYAMVNVQSYQVAVTGSTIAECTEAYAKKLKQNNIEIDIDIDEIKDATENNDTDTEGEQIKYETVKGIVSDIRTAVMDGESVYFIQLQGKNTYYTISASNAQNVVILNIGDSVTVKYEKANGAIVEAQSVK